MKWTRGLTKPLAGRALLARCILKKPLRTNGFFAGKTLISQGFFRNVQKTLISQRVFTMQYYWAISA